MRSIQIRVFLDDGPRVGEILTMRSGRDGEPPHQITVADPFGRLHADGITSSVTTYHLHGLDERRRGYVYRTGRPE
jgi:hypothetical protein